ncbi:MAG TPA: N-acetylmuramoyl-L-alanine amidase [Caldilineae bacterium]|nr:N-acetylmuramoyl-L-alanine amidase [Caldilineae bacterium]
MRTETLRRLERIALLILLLALGGSLFLAWEQIEQARFVLQAASRSSTLRPIPEVVGRRIGLIAGHSGYDSGAVCPDGLREVDINQAVASRTAEYLRQAGAIVDVLTEFDVRLEGYRADALLSIHSDSCIDASGFKIARSEASIIPSTEDLFVACLYQAYEQVTGLPRHDGSITHDMTKYHAFRVIDPKTPAAIIELGFMGGDREVLTAEQDRVAYGLAQGIICFLSGKAVPTLPASAPPP